MACQAPACWRRTASTGVRAPDTQKQCTASRLHLWVRLTSPPCSHAPWGACLLPDRRRCGIWPRTRQISPAMAQEEAGTLWLTCFATAEFDVDSGQVMRHVFPAGSVSGACPSSPSLALPASTRLPALPAQLTPSQAHKVACLALPDSNTGQMGDSIHSFRTRLCVCQA